MVELNAYGNVDVRSGVPSGGTHVSRLPATQRVLTAAGVIYGRALIGFDEYMRHRWAPDFSGWVIEAEWQQKVAASEAVRELEDRDRKRRSVAAKTAAATRRKNRMLGSTPYGQFLLALEAAQDASDRAKSRAANGKHFHDYCNTDGTTFARFNYHRSREARDDDYWEKQTSLFRACHLAEEAHVVYGWKEEEDEDIPARWVVYFDLLVGQVSFHSLERREGADYEGEWDGEEGACAGKIRAAIHLHLKSEETPVS